MAKSLVSLFAGLLLLTSAKCGEISRLSNENSRTITRESAELATNGFSYKEAMERTSNRLTSTENCPTLLPQELIDEIKSYNETAQRIMDLILVGDFKGKAYEELHELVDRYPVRPSGHQSLEDSIDYMMERMKAFKLDRVWGEQVLVPHWIR